MTIEFNTAAGVPDLLVSRVKQKLLELHHKDKDISGAHVNFHKHHVPFNQDFVCEIDLNIFGSSIMVSRNAENYAKAASAVLEEVSQRVDDQLRRRETIDIVSSVRV